MQLIVQPLFWREVKNSSKTMYYVRGEHKCFLCRVDGILDVKNVAEHGEKADVLRIEGHMQQSRGQTEFIVASCEVLREEGSE